MFRLKTAKTNWEELILVCGKCTKKLDGGFGPKGRDRLDKVLKRALKAGKGRRAKVKIVRSPCLNVCPKHAVTVVRGHAPRVVSVVPAGMPADEVVEALGLGSGGEVHVPAIE